ncbi:MAG: uS17 family ribosomal protein [Phycisphaerae bacterium]
MANKAQGKSKVKGSVMGTVASISGRRTIKVVMNHLDRHPMVGKFVRRRTSLAVDDPQSEAKEGDTVEIVPCRPISKTKSWRLVRVVRSTDTVE